MLLDSQLIINIFYNSKLLTDIYNADYSILVKSTYRSLYTRQRENFSRYDKVWYSPNIMANILSLNNVKQRFYIIYNS